MQVMAIKTQSEYFIRMYSEITIFHNIKKKQSPWTPSPGSTQFPLDAKPGSTQYP
jgi:hypothetical protein